MVDERIFLLFICATSFRMANILTLIFTLGAKKKLWIMLLPLAKYKRGKGLNTLRSALKMAHFISLSFWVMVVFNHDYISCMYSISINALLWAVYLRKDYRFIHAMQFLIFVFIHTIVECFLYHHTGLNWV